MAKLTLVDLTNLENQSSAVATLASNNTATETAMEKTLSRDGTSPNTMEASLDMNSNTIVNLPEPTTDTEPVTKGYGDDHYGDSLASATAAAASATAAATSATSAASSATSSASSASAASTSATAAATSATSAAATLAAVSYKYTWSTDTTATDPTTGKIKVNNAAPGSATALYISETDADANALSAEIARWDDSSNATGRARIKIAKNATNFLLLTITSAVADNGTWDTYTVSGASLTGSFSDGDTVYVSAATSGADGVGGDFSSNTATSVDSEIVLFSGTAGKTGKRATTTGILKGTSGVLSAASAGTDYVAPSGALGTPSSGTLTNCTGLPVAGITASTSTALGVGSIELGHATDTTVSRSSAGVIAVEGVDLPTNIPQNSQSTAYTLVLADAQKHILHPTADNNARTFTIPANASVAYPIGTSITFINQINTVTIAINSDTLTWAGPNTTGSRTLAAGGWATAIKITSTIWFISGVGLS